MIYAGPLRCVWTVYPAGWRFPAEAVWLSGWLEGEERDAVTDLRLRLGDQLFLCLHAGEPLDTAVLRRAFSFFVSAPAEGGTLRLEAWYGNRGWAVVYAGVFTGGSVGSRSLLGPRLPAQLARVLAAGAAGLRHSSGVLAPLAAEAAQAEPLAVLPNPPFLGALETPGDDGYFCNGRLLVSGWVAHGSQRILRVSARVNFGAEVQLSYGLQRRDVAEAFPALMSAGHSHFVGLVGVPTVAVGLASVLVFAETEAGGVHLVFARRLLIWGTLLPRTPAWAARLSLAWRLGVTTRRLAAAYAPYAASSARQRAEAAPFAKATPLSIYLSSFIDHSLPVSVRAAAAKTSRLNVLFVLHGDFSCNSAQHVIALANELEGLGCASLAAIPERSSSLADHESPACGGLLHTALPAGVVFPDGRGPDIIHAWTPREVVRLATVQARRAHPAARLFVHLEDNEIYLTEKVLGATATATALRDEESVSVPAGLMHPVHGPRFLASANGLSAVIDTLLDNVPPHVPCCQIIPGADPRYFFPRPMPDVRRWVFPEAVLLFYGGNVHQGNAEDMQELYQAVVQMNEEGVPARLLRTGHTLPGCIPEPLLRSASSYVLDLGWIPRNRDVAPLMALADILVQPGRDDVFNAQRVPSKLPEFFSVGRPVILPKTNLGRLARHKKDAYVLEIADAAGIVRAVAHLRANPALAATLAAGSAAFASEHCSWPRAAARLAACYRSVLSGSSSYSHGPRCAQ